MKPWICGSKPQEEHPLGVEVEKVHILMTRTQDSKFLEQWKEYVETRCDWRVTAYGHLRAVLCIIKALVPLLGNPT